MRKDIEHLNLLAIFHYVMGGLTALAAFFPLIYVALGLTILGGAGGPGAPQALGWIFVIGGGAFSLILFVFAFVTGLAGYYLHKRKARIFCFVIAAIQCTQAPFGTVLGIFTILVLCRESVQELFERGGRYRDPEEEDYHALPYRDFDRPADRPRDGGYYQPRRGDHED